MRIRFPLLIRFTWSSEGLWYMIETKGNIKHHMLIQVAVMQKENAKALEIIIGKLAIAIAWIGFT